MDDLKRKSVDEQAAGTGQKIKGKVKEGAGKLTGDQDLEAEGQMDQGEGNLRQNAGKLGRGISDAAERAGEKLRGED